MRSFIFVFPLVFICLFPLLLRVVVRLSWFGVILRFSFCLNGSRTAGIVDLFNGFREREKKEKNSFQEVEYHNISRVTGRSANQNRAS